MQVLQDLNEQLTLNVTFPHFCPTEIINASNCKTGVFTFLKDIISIFLRIETYIDLHLVHQEHIKNSQNTV